ncbi:MAG: hypothetical protein NVSMB49_25270 [Ktedonobacteraceae bacterium]
MASVTALPVQPVAPATHTRIPIVQNPFSLPYSLFDSITFSDGLYAQLYFSFYRLLENGIGYNDRKRIQEFEMRSFTEAAYALDLTQSAVSHALSTLERELG